MGIAASMAAVGLGFLALIGGAGWLVRGAAALALRFGLSPLVIGLTVVAFGTSAPELLVSLVSVLTGKGDVAVGNVLGSNIANVLLILGASAMVRPLPSSRSALRVDLPIGLVLVAGVAAFGWNGSIERWQAALLLAGFGVFMLAAFVRRQAPDLGDEVKPDSTRSSLLRLAGGLVGLVVGAELLVRGAIVLARAAGLSEALIGLTLVAVGTSLPELATSVVAAHRGQTEISVGNILGSNVFNIGWVLGLAYLIRPGSIAPVLARHDALVAGAASLLLGVLLATRHRLGRTEGAVLLGLYAVYVGFLFWRG